MSELSLTSKQEAFVWAYMATGNATEAYRQAYDAKGMSLSAISTEAYKLKQHPQISHSIMELQEAQRESHLVDHASVSQELDMAYAIAKEQENPSAMITASMGKAKLHGLFDPKQKLQSPVYIVLDQDDMNA